MKIVNSKKLYALVDCNTFYVSCERVFKPELRNQPVAVMTNNDGCVCAASPRAKKAGLHIGAPIFKYQKTIKKHDIKLLSSNYSLYADMSKRVMSILKNFSPQIEIYSVDEAFLLFSNCLIKNWIDYGQEIKNRVYQWTGIPISIGLAPTKTLAKIANHLAKKNPEYKGVFHIKNTRAARPLLKKIKVVDIWGIGRQHYKFLNRHQIFTASDLVNQPDTWIRKNMALTTLRTVYELRGVPCLTLEDYVPPRQGILSSRSFGRPVTKLKELQQSVAYHATRVSEKLQQQKSVATYILVFIKTDRFKKPYYSKSGTAIMPIPTNYTPDIINYAWRILNHLYKPNKIYKKVGVLLTGIMPDEIKQPNFFVGPYPFKRHQIITDTINRINKTWGQDTIKPAAMGLKQEWQMKRQELSPRYTTCWEELLEIRD